MAPYSLFKVLTPRHPAITLSQLRILLEVVLPLRIFDTEGAIKLVQWIQINKIDQKIKIPILFNYEVELLTFEEKAMRKSYQKMPMRKPLGAGYIP